MGDKETNEQSKKGIPLEAVSTGDKQKPADLTSDSLSNRKSKQRTSEQLQEDIPSLTVITEYIKKPTNKTSESVKDGDEEQEDEESAEKKKSKHDIPEELLSPTSDLSP